jgi:hypothetical protein
MGDHARSNRTQRPAREAADGAVIAELKLSSGSAQAVVSGLSNLINNVHAKDVENKMPVVSIALRPYRADANGVSQLPADTEIQIRDRYLGSDGLKRIEDIRPTLILVDESNGYWPLIVRMPPELAKSLRDQLELRLKD